MRLSGLSRPETVCQVVVDGLASQFPPLRSTRAPLGNLPRTRDSFVGRGHELSELAALLKSHRAITLTGVGGVGKTRLALAAAEAASGAFDDGVWFVELAEVLHGSLVAQAVASELAIQPQAGWPCRTRSCRSWNPAAVTGAGQL